MPTYDYECSACGARFEAFQSIKDKPLTTCEKCGKKKIRRLIGAGAGLIFKGSGFYITDYRGKDYGEAAKKDAAPSTESKPADAKSGDAKAAEPKASSDGSSTKSSTPAAKPAEKRKTKKT
ncbi:MAG: zinc ribbon domain-containing protein [Planctomycetes bacterium]|nr:zinc ribbon domain-containing protein [Planctomycetota bacterium]MCC7171187.1 zinc ribbon domain-containing protein [Planctomycetota bacterium]